MPTDLGRPFTIVWRGHPPHMLDPDVPVWYRFLEKYGPYFKKLYYDVLLGGIWLTDEQAKDPLQKMWRYDTAKRADALAELESEIWLIEVASYPGLRAVGQLQSYLYLWNEDPKIDKPVRCVMVSERIDTDLAATMAFHGIQIYIV